MLGTKGKGFDKLGTKMQKSFLIYVFPNTGKFGPNNKESRYIKSVYRSSFFTNTKSTVKNISRA